MRKAWLIVVVVGVLVGAVLALRPRPAPAEEEPGRAPAPALSLPTFEEVGVHAAASEGLSLTGRVLDSAGRPVPGAEVALIAAAQRTLGSVACEEDALPLFSCPARETALTLQALLEQGLGQLTPGAATRADAEGRFRFDRLAGVAFTVWASSPHHGAAVRERAAPGEPVELFLPPPRSVAGEVTDDTGRRVPGARVWAVSHRLPLRHETRTGPDGRFRLEGLGEGPFLVLAAAPGLLPAVASPVEAGPAQVPLVLTTARALEVQVRRDGRPVEGEVRLEADHLHRSARTRGGAVRFEGLFPDSLVVTAAAGSASAVPLQVTLREPVTRVTLELEEGGRLLVTVVDEAGQPVPTPTLRLWTTEGERVEERRAGTGELVVFGPLGPGDYLLQGHAEGFREASLPVRLRPGDVPLELAMTQGTVISGRVLDVYGRPAPNISVLVQPTGEPVQADAEGRFTALVPSPGLYTLHAHHSDWGGVEKRVTAPATGVELALEPKASVEVVAQVEGRRVEGASAMLWLDRNNVFRSDRMSGPDGRIPMRGLPPGTYQVAATHPDYLPSERTRVTVADGQTQGVTAELRPGARLEGEVVDEQGAPVSGALVGVVPRVAEPATTDGQGRFLVRALRGDRAYRLEVHHAEYDQTARVEATPGGAPTRVVMRRRALVRGRVVAEDGTPVRRYRLNDRDVSSVDGRFELPLGGRDAAESQLVVSVEAAGFEPLVVERPLQPELGDLVLTRAPLVTGQVREQGGAPVPDAVVSCDVCDESVLSGPDGRYTLHAPPYVAQYTVTAEKGPLSGRATVARGQRSADVTVEPALPLGGTVFGADGRPAAGVALEVGSPERPESQVAVTDAEGRYSLRLPAGAYRLALGADGEFSGAPVVLVRVGTGGAQVNVGPGPGTVSLAVRVRPERGRGLWVLQGEVPAAATSPRELASAVSYGQMAYQPRAERILFGGLPPGRYTVVWGPYHPGSGQPPVVRVVDLPRQGELDLVGGS